MPGTVFGLEMESSPKHINKGYERMLYLIVVTLIMLGR